MDSRQAVRVPGATSVRLAGLAGVIFFVLIVIAASFRSGAPTAADTGKEVLDWVTKHHGRMQLGAVLVGLGMAAVLVWLAGLFRALRRVEGGTPGLAVAALGGGILAAAATVMGALIEGVTATRIADLGTSGARVFWTAFLLSLGTTLLGLFVLIGATAVICLRTQLFARWFGGASVALAIVSAAGACTIGYTSDGIQVVAGIAVLLDSVWILLVGLFLLREPGLALP